MSTREDSTTDHTPLRLTLQIDKSLLDYFRDGMQRDRLEGDPALELTLFLASLLNNTAYPIEAHHLETGEIKLSYQPRAFADPIF